MRKPRFPKNQSKDRPRAFRFSTACRRPVVSGSGGGAWIDQAGDSCETLSQPTTLDSANRMAGPRPLACSLDCPEGRCPLLQGVPQTMGMRSGFVRLQPGATVGWHTTGQHEEALVILRGKGEVLIDGQAAQAFIAPAFAYIPPTTLHNVLNTGEESLEYVYVVAPAPAKQVSPKGSRKN